MISYFKVLFKINFLKKVFISFLFVGLMAGCVNNVSNEEVNKELEKNIYRLQDSIVKMEEKIEDQNETIKQLEERISDTYVEQTDLTYYDALITQIVESKTAILNDAEVKGDRLILEITYAEKVEDHQSPNGFHLNEFEDATLSINKEVPIFLLKNPTKLTRVEWKEITNTRGFFQLFKKDGEVVFIREVYIP